MSGYRPPYTSNEEKRILQYILEESAQYRLRGDALWKEMEKAGIVERTWHSLKQHFRKKLINQLHNPRYELGKTDLNSIKQGYYETGKAPMSDPDEECDSCEETNVKAKDTSQQKKSRCGECGRINNVKKKTKQVDNNTEGNSSQETSTTDTEKKRPSKMADFFNMSFTDSEDEQE